MRWPAALFLLALTSSFAAEAAAAEVITISHLEGDPLRQSGFEIMREAYRRLGIEAQPLYLPNERALRAAESGETDADVMRIAGIEAAHPGLIRVPERLLSVELLAFTTGLSFKVEGWESLRPYTLCVLRGLKVVEAATQGMNVQSANTVEGLVRALRAGRCEATVLDDPIWLEIDRLHAGPMRALEPPVATMPLFHYVNRRHAELVPRLAEKLREMRADGTIASILAAGDAAVAAAKRRNALPEPSLREAR
jgi:polar amino acid transport system substrate-binding protein